MYGGPPQGPPGPYGPPPQQGYPQQPGYAPYPQPQGYMMPPQQQPMVIVNNVKAPFNHGIHIVLDVITCGGWLIVHLICWALH